MGKQTKQTEIWVFGRTKRPKYEFCPVRTDQKLVLTRPNRPKNGYCPDRTQKSGFCPDQTDQNTGINQTEQIELWVLTRQNFGY